MIEIDRLTLCRSGKTILDNLSLTLNTQEITVVLGANGSGKTSLMKSLLGLYPTTQGAIRYDGVALERLSWRERSQKIAYVMQHNPIRTAISVWEYILMGSFAKLSLFGVPSHHQRREVQMLAQELQMDHLLHKQLSMLSGGELQLIHFARALYQKSPYLLLDEPASALDYQKQQELSYYLLSMLQERQLGALINVHDPNMALRIANRIIILEQGRIVTDVHKQEDHFLSTVMHGLNHIFNQSMALVTSDYGDLVVWRHPIVDP